jgi:Fatty acid hydroxylase
MSESSGPASELDALRVERRDALRARELGQTPGWYSPTLHLLIPAAVGIAIFVVALLEIAGLRAVELLVLPACFLVFNGLEWWIHRDLLHRRRPLVSLLYDQHTAMHHMIYVTQDMAMRDRREWRLVLMPGLGVVLSFVGLVPFAAALWHLLGSNVACLFAMAWVAYMLGYEWLHLSFHLPSESWLGGSRLIRWLRWHHAVHHDPRIMRAWNLNVTVPLWDWLLGTIHSGALESLE